MGTNGAITFGEALGNQSPEQFPLTFWSFLVAPLWVNVDTTAGGNVLWEIYDSSSHSDILAMVDMLIQQEQGDSTFNGLWMLVASWENVEFTDQEDIVSNIIMINKIKTCITLVSVEQYFPSHIDCQRYQILLHLHLQMWRTSLVWSSKYWPQCTTKYILQPSANTRIIPN